MASEIRVGISGWTYKGWRGPFYPEDLPQKRELHFASRQFNSIEINGSFYSLQRPTSYQRWYEETPDDFIFSVKGPRFITHIKRLNDVKTPLANFFASGVFALKEKLGPILWQFPPQFLFKKEVFEPFFASLPQDTSAAAKLSLHSDSHLKFPAYREIDKKRKLRHAVEVRHQSFKDESFIELLREYGIALVFAQGKSTWPYMEDVTSDFIYVRLHGEKQVYVSGYGKKALDRWEKKLRVWRSGRQPSDSQRITDTAVPRKSRDLYVYFDNDVKVRAPYDAISLLQRLTSFEPQFKMKKPNLKQLEILYGPRVNEGR